METVSFARPVISLDPDPSARIREEPANRNEPLPPLDFGFEGSLHPNLGGSIPSQTKDKGNWLAGDNDLKLRGYK